MLRTLFLLGCLTGFAHADSVGGLKNTNCPGNDCFGSLYTLTYTGSPISTSGGNSTYRINLSVDTSNTNLGPFAGTLHSGAFIDSVAIKIANSVVSFVLDSAPGGTSAWPVDELGGNNANGCDGSGAGFFCIEDGTGAVVSQAPIVAAGVTPKPVYNWTFDVTVPTGSLFTAQSGTQNVPSIKVNYDYLSGWPKTEKNTGITSEQIFLQIPEPASWGSFGAALLIAAFTLRRQLGKIHPSQE